MDEIKTPLIWETLTNIVNRVAVVETKTSRYDMEIMELNATLTGIEKSVGALTIFVDEYRRSKREEQRRAQSVQGGLTYIMSMMTGIVASWGFSEFSQGLNVGKTTQIIMAIVIFFIFSGVIGLWKWFTP